MCAASSEQLAVRYCTKSHINQKNRQIYNKKKTGWDNRTKPLPVCLMEILYRLLVKGVILVDFLLRRSEHVMWVAELLCVLQSLLTCYNTGWISRQGDKFFEDTKKSKIFVCVCVCFWEGMSGWAHRSAASSYLLCHTDGSVSEPQTLLLQQGRCENAANYSTHSILHMSFLGSVTSFHTVYLWLVGDSAGHCKWLRVKHKYQRLQEQHQHLFWFNVAWIYELFWLFALKVQYFTFL